MVKISIFGTGYVGLTTGACLANLGHDVVCVDIDEEKISKLKKGVLPFFEPGLKDLVDLNLKQKKLSFSTDSRQAVKCSDVLFIAVGTPSGESGEPDLSSIYAVAETIGKFMDNYKVVVTKSTVPAGTCDKIAEIIRKNSKVGFDVVSNPEFLREGEAVYDFMVPDRIVVGVESDKAKEIIVSVYKSIERTGRPILVTDVKTAELIKYASNAMLATRISFMNEISRLCEKVGADVKNVARGMGFDTRIGHRFLQAGAGFGGSCFPKDVRALISALKGAGCRADILDAVYKVNEMQKLYVVEKLKGMLHDLKGKKIGVWGLSFKPKTDDMREAPSIVVIRKLQEEGAVVCAYDPVAVENARQFLKGVDFADTPFGAVEGADALLVITEWDIFRELDKVRMKELMSAPNILDARNIYSPKEMRALGFNYEGIGR